MFSDMKNEQFLLKDVATKAGQKKKNIMHDKNLNKYTHINVMHERRSNNFTPLTNVMVILNKKN